MKRIKDLFSSAKDKAEGYQTRTYVRFFTESGAHFAEVETRDPAKLELPEDTHHFKFFDRKMKKGETADTRTLMTDAENISPTYYVVDKVISLTKFNAMPAEEKEQLTTEGTTGASSAVAVAITGAVYRYLSTDETNTIAIDRQTMKQLWPQHASSQLDSTPRRSR